MARIIFHVDVNSAFLSWSAVKKLKEEPGSVDLRTIPSAVGGDVKTRHGVITAKSIPAKKYGVKTGEPVMTALRKCPSLVLVPSDFKTYRAYSAAFIRILEKYAPVVEQVSIDEAFLDMTEADTARFSAPAAAPDDPAARTPAASTADAHAAPDDAASGPASASAPGDFSLWHRAAEAIKNEIRDTLGFTVNVGISSNKLLAKMASDFEKPDKIHTLWPEEVPDKLWPLPIGALFGCGGATAARLSSFGIRTIGDAAHAELSILKSILGDKAGSYIHRSANGISSSRVENREEDAKSYSNETTTAEDITEENYAEFLPPILKRLSGKVASRMQRDGVTALTIGVMAKTSDFRRRSRQLTLHDSTNDPEIIFRTAEQLMQELLLGEEGIFSRGQGVRLVGVSASNLDNGEYRQISIFDMPPPASPAEEKSKMKKARLDDMMKALNRRYGSGTVRKGTR